MFKRILLSYTLMFLRHSDFQ